MKVGFVTWVFLTYSKNSQNTKTWYQRVENDEENLNHVSDFVHDIWLRRYGPNKIEVLTYVNLENLIKM